MECVAKEEDETAGRGYCSTNSNGTKPKGAGERQFEKGEQQKRVDGSELVCLEGLG